MNTQKTNESTTLEWLENPKGYFHASISCFSGEVSAIVNKETRKIMTQASGPREDGSNWPAESEKLAEQLLRDAKKEFGEDIEVEEVI